MGRWAAGWVAVSRWQVLVKIQGPSTYKGANRRQRGQAFVSDLKFVSRDPTCRLEPGGDNGGVQPAAPSPKRCRHEFGDRAQLRRTGSASLTPAGVGPSPVGVQSPASLMPTANVSTPFRPESVFWSHVEQIYALYEAPLNQPSPLQGPYQAVAESGTGLSSP